MTTQTTTVKTTAVKAEAEEVEEKAKVQKDDDIICFECVRNCLDVAKGQKVICGYCRTEKTHLPYSPYECPHRWKGWHIQAVDLQREINKSSSSSLRQIMLQEMHFIITEETSTLPNLYQDHKAS